MRILGHGFLSRRKSFKKLNHALQLLKISQIVKADFNTDVLKLRQRVPTSMYNSEIIELFRDTILFDLFKLLFKELKNYPI